MAVALPGRARGILNPRAGEAVYRIGRYAPAAALEPFVDFYWTVVWDVGPRGSYVQTTLPYPSVHLALEHGVSGIVGVIRGKFVRVLEGAGRVFGVKFHPGGFYPFARRPVACFTDLRLPPETVFDVDPRALEHAVLGCHDEHAMVAAIEAFLCRHLPSPDPTVTEVRSIVARIQDDRAITKVDDVVRETGMSKRALQRLFQRYVGVGPKWVIQRYRLHEAVERLSAEDVDGAKLAAELGYADQAHLIHDFRQLVGTTPSGYADLTQRGSGSRLGSSGSQPKTLT
jgi:AraC-like DNA-binding protein